MFATSGNDSAGKIKVTVRSLQTLTNGRHHSHAGLGRREQVRLYVREDDDCGHVKDDGKKHREQSESSESGDLAWQNSDNQIGS